jgi:uncharacterized membrane protein
VRQDWSNNFSEFSERASQSRWPFIVAASALGGFALMRRTKTSAALAAAGVWALQRSARAASPRRYQAKATFAINGSAEQAYSLWRDFAGLSRFLHHIDSVQVLDNQHSEWIAQGPLGKKLRWVAEIVDDQPSQRIAWRSLPGSEVETQGSVEFRPRSAGRGINVTATVEYVPPAGAASRTLALLTGRHPEFTVREDLRRFKAMLEAGEIPTVKGQTQGPRGLSGHISGTLLREPQNASQPQAESSHDEVAPMQEKRIA